MNSKAKYGKIKTIIRKKGNPKSHDALGLLTKIAVAHKTLMSIKYDYNYQHTTNPILAPLTLKTNQSIPKWFTRLIPQLENYLDVIIIRDRRLIGNYIEPIYSLTIIGDKPMALLATHYIDTLFTTIIRLVALKRAKRASINKKARKELRETGRSRVPLIDARVEASQLKETIILSILKTLDNLLESARKDYPVSYRNGVKRKDYVETQLKLKYTNSWRSGLSTRFG